MRRLKELFGIAGPKEEARERVLSPTGLSASAWIMDQNRNALEITDAGTLPTSQGKATIIDPLCLMKPQTWIDVPEHGGQDVVFFDPAEGRNSKMALNFSDSEVAGGDLYRLHGMQRRRRLSDTAGLRDRGRRKMTHLPRRFLTQNSRPLGAVAENASFSDPFSASENGYVLKRRDHGYS